MATHDSKSNSSSPSIADSSMAYMPKPDGDEVSEKADELLLDNNKKEETKTMADIAEELGGDKITNTPQVDPKIIKPHDTPEETEHLVVKADPRKVASRTGGDGAPPPSRLEPKEEDNGGGGKKILIVLLVLSLVIAGALGYLWWSQKQQITALQQATQKQAEENKEPSDDKSTSVSSDSKTRTIPELGLTYAFVDDVSSITYRYRETIDANKQPHKVITFSSTKVVEAERKVSNSAPKCTAEFSPLGALTSYATGDTYKDGKIEDVKVDGESVVKIGDTYYVYEASQSVCSADTSVMQAITTEKSAMPTFIKSLKEQK